MAEVTNELMYELLKRMQADIAGLKQGQRDHRDDILSLRNQVHSVQGDINGLRASIGHIEDRLDRIENRLEIRELAERGQSPYNPNA